MIGLKRGEVYLTDHEIEWETNATETIQRLFAILGDVAVDIQHIGSTAITSIKAKPIIDIAVGVSNLDDLAEASTLMEENRTYTVSNNRFSSDLLYVANDTENRRTHQIHILTFNSPQWGNYIIFRDYMNAFPDKAKEYETLKVSLTQKCNNIQIAYTDGKHDFVVQTLQIARIWDVFGRIFTHIEPITKGWSEDKKYCVTKSDGIKYLLRISPIERYETRKALFDILLQVADLDIPMCKPVEFGTCTEGVYSLQTWIDGKDAEDIIPLLSETEQYVLGVKSGEILRKIHSIPAPENQEDWYTRFNCKTNKKIEKYHECPLKFEGDDKIIEYIEQNRDLLKNRPQCFQHGDYHIGNMMIENGELVIIDFDRFDFGDPWEEFNRIVWCSQKSPHFATGQLNGYFGGMPPLDFFKRVAFYIGSNTLSSIYWSIPLGQGEIDTMMKQSHDVLAWYDSMKNPVPTWYLKDFYIQYIDGIPFKLKSPFDFSFLSKYGRVFKVFDEQDSGNICFGVQNGDNHYFIKFAGAPTEQYKGKAEETIARLKASIPVYQDIGEHPSLICFISAEEIGGGYAAVFAWTNALGVARMYPINHKRFMALPVEKRIQVFEDILAFHVFVCECGYVAIDFYDGSIMYDFENEKTVICDIDFYQKMPYCGEMGLWGSSRFVSPEECTQGEIIDEVTTVYTMGQTAFCLFTDSNHSSEAWPLNAAQYAVVEKAVSDDRNKRQQSIRLLIEEWERERKWL